jgi:tetratricopeptide (TPR) repeat protein
VPGKAYEPSGWEFWAPLNKSYEAGDYETVAVGLREAVEENPQYAGLFYNLACVESLTGRTPDAIDHLRRAIDLSDQYREYAKGDSDFDPIREEPAFRELVPA